MKTPKEKLHIITVVGARPQFIKAAPISRVLKDAQITEHILHTGQHYDYEMSQMFFEQLSLPEPKFHLGVGSGTHGSTTGAMLAGVEEVLLRETPDCVLIYGDTNSTLAGALAAAKLHIPVIHIEAGLRSFNRRMPEEVNRVVADQLSDLLFCPSEVAVANLKKEGITQGVHVVGDVMADANRLIAERLSDNSDLLARYSVQAGEYILVTLHRAENTDDPVRLNSILEALNSIKTDVLFPIHPRTRKAIDQSGVRLGQHIQVLRPLPYIEMISLLRTARLMATDSGGLQKESYWCGIPCVTLRDETEWVETVASGWNCLVGAQTNSILNSFNNFRPAGPRPQLYGDGYAADRCCLIISARYGSS